MKAYIVDKSNRQEIYLDDDGYLGIGGVGIVWSIDNNRVVKIYKSHSKHHGAAREKLLAMIDQPPKNLKQKINGTTYPLFAWPTHIVEDENGQCIGFVMPELDFQNSISVAPFTNPREATRLTRYQNSLNYRYQLTANISSLLADLHKQGHAFIDFKELNIRLVREMSNGKEDEYKGFIAGFLDCDSFLITDKYGKKFPCTVLSPEITSPEYHQNGQKIVLLDEYHDRFVLALLIFKILNYGIHPYDGRPKSTEVLNKIPNTLGEKVSMGLYAYSTNGHPMVDPYPTSIHKCWDDKTRSMFDRAFLASQPSDRPSAQEWRDHLRSVIHDQQFQSCKKYPREISHVHIRGKSCYRCTLDNLGTIDSSDDSNVIGTIINEPTFSSWNTVKEEPSPWKQPSYSPNSETDQKPAHSSTTQPNYNKTITSSNSSESTTSSNQFQPANVDYSNLPEPPPKKPKKWWIIGIIVAILIVFGIAVYAATLNSQSTSLPEPEPTSSYETDPQPMSQELDLEPDVVTESESVMTPSLEPETDNDDAIADNTESIDTATSMDEAVAKIDDEIEENKNKDSSEDLSEDEAIELYANYLNLDPDFLRNVIAVSEHGENDLIELLKAGYSENEYKTISLATELFRTADLDYFRNLPKDKKKAAEYNEKAKEQFWKNKNPSKALYYQTTALKNNPLNSEIAANLAFYLHKKNLPGASEFALFSMQLPRSDSKQVNTYMVELLSGQFAAENQNDFATGGLLAAFYSVNERDKRCASMLKYPKNYPKLKTAAEKTFAVIERQVENGELKAPDNCLPPLAWVE